MPVKCYSIVIGHKNEAKYASIGDELIWEENTVKLLGLIIDRELTFDTYARAIYKKNLTETHSHSSRISKYPFRAQEKSFNLAIAHCS